MKKGLLSLILLLVIVGALAPFYLDETGKHKSYEPEPATVKVKELGISGWLKGQ